MTKNVNVEQSDSSLKIELNDTIIIYAEQSDSSVNVEEED